MTDWARGGIFVSEQKKQVYVLLPMFAYHLDDNLNNLTA